MAYIAQYSQRPGAVSSRWVDDVSVSKKKERYHILTNDLIKSSLNHNSKMVGKTYRVLIRGKERKEKYLSGLTEGRINVRIYSSDINLVGKILDVQISSASEFSVAGELVESNRN